MAGLQVVAELTLPQDIERMRAASAPEQETVDRLEIGPDAVCTTSSIEVRVCVCVRGGFPHCGSGL